MTMTQEQKEREQGLSLVDVGPLYELVPLSGGRPLKVFGISVQGIFSVFQRYPEIMQWFKGGKVDLPLMITQAPAAIAAVIAAGCGSPGDELAEEHASMLGVETQLDVIEAIGRLTFKNGFGPFVQRIVALSAQANSVNYGRGLATKSPAESNPALPPDMTPNPSGP